MSGNLVQRGEIAVADKYSRAKAAVTCGASLVLELPFPYSMLSARDFAAAGVYISEKIGADALGFGVEDEFSKLERISQITASISFEQRLDEFIKEKKNISYPKAKEMFLKNLLGGNSAEIIKKPNNILTLEYLAAIKRGNFKIKPCPVTRDITLRSSSTIRAERDRSKFLSLLPECSAAVYGNLSESELPRSTENLSQFIIGTLRMYKGDGEVYGTPKDLLYSIKKTADEVSKFSQLVDICRNNIYTASRVRRSVLSIVFGITPHDAATKPVYSLVLAADDVGCYFLRNHKKRLGIELLTKPSHIKKSDQKVKNAFYREVEVDNILALSSPTNKIANSIKKTPFILSMNNDQTIL